MFDLLKKVIVIQTIVWWLQKFDVERFSLEKVKCCEIQRRVSS